MLTARGLFKVEKLILADTEGKEGRKISSPLPQDPTPESKQHTNKERRGASHPDATWGIERKNRYIQLKGEKKKPYQQKENGQAKTTKFPKKI